MSAALGSANRRLHPRFGIEISGVDLGRPLRGATRTRIDDAVRRERVVVVRGQRLDAAAQLRLAGALGTLVGSRRSRLRGWYLPDVRMMIDPAADARRQEQQFVDEQWHADLSWAATGHVVTVLYAVDAQPGAAPTAFADTVSGYDALDDATKREIGAWRAYHHVARSREIRFGMTSGRSGPGPRISWPQRVAEELRASRRALHARPAVPVAPPGATHPVVNTDAHARTYVRAGDHAWTLTHTDEREGLTLIDDLNRRVTSPDNVYEHEWSPGDLVLFDNRSLLHRRVPPSDADARRELRRCVIWR